METSLLVRTVRSLAFEMGAPAWYVRVVLFHTGAFAAFFVVVWIVYWSLARHVRLQTAFVVAASWVFYGAWDHRFLLLLVGSTVVDYLVGRRLERVEDPGARRRLLATSLVVNLGILGTFKYFDFFAASAAEALEALGFEVQPVLLDVVLPVGISFYTFQTLAYSVDVYRRRIPAERNFLRFAAFVAFFPQLVAGPIERAERLLPQLAARRRLRVADQVEGAALFAVGLCKKVVIADRLAPFVDVGFDMEPDELWAADVVLVAAAFAFQIWGDFSGYTDMARGTARMLGIDLVENFHGPYFSRSPREFWRRWHVSLSTWLRDYLYIPLGGSRGTRWQTARALLATMLLGGLWHGAAWTFVIWGLVHGLWLVAHRAAAPWLRRLPPQAAALGVLPTFVLVTLAWIPFRAPTLDHALVLYGELADLSGDLPWENARYVVHFAWLGVVLQALRRFAPKTATAREHLPLRLVLAAYALVLVLTEGAFDAPRAFVYFQF